MDDNILGSALGQLGKTAKQAVKQVVKIPEEMAKDLGGQVGGGKPTEEKPAASAPLSGATSEPRWKSDEERVKFLRDLYGSSEKTSSGEQNSSAKKTEPQSQKTSLNPLVASQEKKPSEFEEQIKDKTPEEQKKLMELRNKLHKENYYDPTFNRPQKQEERASEKVENEKKQEMVDLQKKEEKKPQPLAVVREQNKTEMFRGASG